MDKKMNHEALIQMIMELSHSPVNWYYNLRKEEYSYNILQINVQLMHWDVISEGFLSDVSFISVIWNNLSEEYWYMQKFLQEENTENLSIFIIIFCAKGLGVKWCNGYPRRVMGYHSMALYWGFKMQKAMFTPKKANKKAHVATNLSCLRPPPALPRDCMPQSRAKCPRSPHW